VVRIRFIVISLLLGGDLEVGGLAQIYYSLYYPPLAPPRRGFHSFENLTSDTKWFSPI